MSPSSPPQRRGLLDILERVGNLLPDPVVLFFAGTILVVLLSALAANTGWSVQPKMLRAVVQPVLDASGAPVLDPATAQPQTAPILDASGRPRLELVDDLSRNNGEPIVARSLLSADGLYWAVSSMVDNFINFPPLGVVLVGMLGIGLAEKAGFVGAALKAMMLIVPRSMLTPTVVFLGVMSSLGTDAGYIVLPPVAAALYVSVGRSPLAGIAAAFAGIAGGFNANLLVTSLDPLLAGFTQSAAQSIDPAYTVNPACNWWFMIASTFLLTIVGWGVTRFFVERRLAVRPPGEGGPSAASNEQAAAQRLEPREWRALVCALAAAALGSVLFIAFAILPGWPFDDSLGRLGDDVRGLGRGDHFDRWVESIVPMLFVLFVIPGIVYGAMTGSIRRAGDAARLMIETLAGVAPIIVLAFFAAQFIEYFKFSNLDKMLAYSGGAALASASLPPWLLIIAFIAFTALFNLLIASMSAKYAMLAPIFVPMLMVVGISPELTQCSYRIADSVTNTVTPLNAYMIIILGVLNRYAPRAGMGTLIAMMTPYAITFLVAWTALLLIWMALGLPLGMEGPLSYTPS